jgi:hypothetical protein
MDAMGKEVREKKLGEWMWTGGKKVTKDGEIDIT